MNNIHRATKYAYSSSGVTVEVFDAIYTSRHLAGKADLITEVGLTDDPRKIRVYLDNGKSYVARRTTGIENKQE